MEQNTNHVVLTGALASVPRYSHSNHGRRFCAFFLEITRLSGAVDCLPILAPEFLLDRVPAEEGDCLCITGQLRSYNQRSAAGHRLLISVLAQTLCVCSVPHENQVSLLGTVCKEPVYRRTPLGREICDLMLAVNRAYRRSDYLPCILWGRSAQAAADCAPGSTLYITGRLQSRQYIKRTEGAAVQRTAYEVSAASVEQLTL